MHPLGSNGALQLLCKMTCESCGVRFSFLKKKKRCRECQKDFCSACLMREAGPRHLLCQTCRILTAVPLDHSELMKLRVRELRHFLAQHDVPIDSCTEKTDLVDLIIRMPRQQASSESTTSSNEEPPSSERSFFGFTPPAFDFTPPAFPSFSFSPMRSSSVFQSSSPSSRGRTEHTATSVPPQPQESADNLTTKKIRIEDMLEVNAEELSSRQLKEILSRSFVAYRGVCEKAELIEKVKRLQEEVRENRRRAELGLPEENLCKICMDAPVDCVLLECGHMLSCTQCGRLLNECPVCRQYVIRVVHTFRA